MDRLMNRLYKSTSSPTVTFLWIWILTFVFFIRGIDIIGVDVTIIKIVYVTLALICIISFQFSRDIWQKMIIHFWILVVLYATSVFIISLLFQFTSVRELLEKMGVSEEWQVDVGLFILDLSELIMFIILESIIIVSSVVLQIILRKTNPVATIRLKFVEKMVEVLDTFFDITKLTIFGIIMACIYKVNAINFFILLAAVLSMVLRRTFRYIIIQLISVTAALILFAQLVNQLHHIGEAKNVTCTSGNDTVILSTESWIGMGKVEHGESMSYNVIGIIALVTVYTVIIKEGNIIEGLRLDAGWDPQKMFSDSTYLQADNDFISFIKYILKYGFYRYGIEFSFIFIALLIQARLDVWALVYSLWLLIFIVTPNEILHILWPVFIYFEVICIPLQYAFSLGLWPEMCFGYEWEDREILKNTFLWMQLPIGSLKPQSYKLFWDSVVFLFALCQDSVFEFEQKSNFGHLMISSPRMSPVDATSASFFDTRTTFRLLRYSVFCSLPIVSAVAFFLSATTTITIFSIPYGFGFVMILWFSDDYFSRSSNRSMLLWKYLLIFSVLMIFIKTCLQIPACIFMDYLTQHSCWIVQLFGITCLRISTKTIAILRVPIWNTAEIPANSCWYLPTTVGIEWDVFCFISLLFHRRFLQSNYFSEMVKEASLNAKFSNRAVKILEKLNEKEMRDMRDRYGKNLEKIKKNMRRLKESQKRIQGIKMAEPMTHQEAVTSGDYYMFHDSEKQVKLVSDLGDEQKSKEEPESPQTPSVSKFMETVLKTDIERAIKLADSSSLGSDKSSKSSSNDSNKEKCYKCKCTTKEATDLSTEFYKKNDEIEETMNTGQSPAHTTKSSKDALSKDHSNDSTTSRRPSTVILKGDKLQPFVPSQRKTSEDVSVKTTGTSVTKSSSPKHEKSSYICSCSCEDCKCKSGFTNIVCYKLCLTIKFVKVFVTSCISSMIQLFNRLSYDYKYIKKEMEKEKENAKHQESTSTISSTVPPLMHDHSAALSEGQKKQTYQLPIYMKLVLSFHDVLMSNFNTVCFLSVLLLQMKDPALFCLPLTMMVFVWGSLSVPRPTKRFWKIIITYATSILLIECIFRSQLIQYNERYSKLYQINQLFGIAKTENNSFYYLLVILAVFLQRRLLIDIGLWPIEPPLERGHNIFSTGIMSVKNFFKKLLYERYSRIPVDVYTHIFVCDFVNIFVFIFGFASVTIFVSEMRKFVNWNRIFFTVNEKREDGVSRYFSENKIPPAMLIIFVVQCLMIFIDRWIYLRRHVVAKLIFQFIQIIMIHFCLFLLLPAATFRRFNQWFFPSLWYSIKCVYLLLSAYQIRCGYPPSVHGHALCQGYNVINMYLYQIYLFFPFVYELRTITDWMWTETTLTLSEWLGMEDIFCTVFLIKCWRNYDNKYSYRRGQKITSTVKFTVGGGVVLLFFLLLLFPLAFFAFGRAAGKMNLPQEMQIIFRLDSYQPIFTGYSFDIDSVTTSQWLRIKDLYRFYPRATTFLSEYYAEDVGVVRFSNYSTSGWEHSSVFTTALASNLRIGQPVTMTAKWSLIRNTENMRQSNLVNGINSIVLTKKSSNELLRVLQGTQDKFTVDNICPKFLKVSSIATAYPVEALMISYEDTSIPPYSNLTFQQDQLEDDSWWQSYEYYPNSRNLLRAVDTIVSKQNKEILIFTFNDKIFPPGIFSYFSAQGIIGLYTTFLISLGLIIRRLCRGRANQVFLDYLPNVDGILQLLLDIYFVREHKDGKLEEDLYAKLIFLFRSPETLIRWTRKPEESDDS